MGGGFGPSEAQAPEGFRAAGMSQALVEYIQPLLDRAGESADPNNVMNLGMLVYNYALAREKGENPEHSSGEIQEMLQRELDLGREDASELLRYMVERKEHLLPDHIQTDLSATTMFIRKTQSIEIPEPHPTDLISDFAEPEQSRDLSELLSSLDRLEETRKSKEDLSDGENLLNNAPKLAKDCFAEWFRACGGVRDASTLSQFIFIYVEFVYGYQPFDEGEMGQDVSPAELKHFFFHHLPRKIYLEDPAELAYAPAAISLFHAFLHLSGWLDEERAQIKAGEILDLQGGFTDMLRQSYS